MIHQISIHVISMHGLCLKCITLSCQLTFCQPSFPASVPIPPEKQKTPWNLWLCSTYTWPKRGTYQRGLLPKITIQGANISHLGTTKIIFKSAKRHWDMGNLLKQWFNDSPQQIKRLSFGFTIRSEAIEQRSKPLWHSMIRLVYRNPYVGIL